MCDVVCRGGHIGPPLHIAPPSLNISARERGYAEADGGIWTLAGGNVGIWV